MCRLFGISYNDQPEAVRTSVIAASLFIDLVRGGPHAFGWMSYNEEDNSIAYAKSPGRCDSDENFDWILDEVDNDAKWFVGHTRFATNGDPEDNRNNHPVWHGNIVGVHNGVLKDWEPILEVTGREDPEAEVDSEAIFAAVNRWGPKNGLSKIHGAMVTLYANLEKPHVLHLARTAGRSVTLGWTDKGNLIWASEEQALHNLKDFGVNFVKMSKVSENRLLLIRNGKIIQKIRFRPIERKVEPFKFNHQDALVRLRAAQARIDGMPVPSALDDLWDDDADYYARQELRAQRRGRKLFPNNHKRRHPDGGRKLVYYKGNFLTVDEYTEAMTRKS